MKLSKIKNHIKKKFFLQTPSLLISKKKETKLFKNLKYIRIDKEDLISKKKDFFNYINSFGTLNADKTFYIIKREPGTGLFSNLTFVLNHLKIAKINNFIPFVDMENFYSIYNEEKSIKSTSNAWEYYFKNLSEFKIEEIYKSKNVLITENTFYKFFDYSINSNNLISIFNNEIFLKENLSKLINKIKKNIFKNKKILAIHFRGTSYKQSPGHPFPATKKQMIELTKEILNKENIDLIFLSTEEKNYLNIFKKKFPKQLFYLESSYRSDKNDAFKIYPRNNHRYKLGKEILIETYLMSFADYFVYVDSNVSKVVLALNKNKNTKNIIIENGYNSRSELVSPWAWYVKKNLPIFLGGFKRIKF